MGSVFVRYTAEGYSARECFDKLKREYQREYGCNGYTGTIASCILGYCSTNSSSYSKKNETDANKLITKKCDDDYFGDKGVLEGIDLGVVGYDTISVKLKRYNNKPKYKLMYVVKDEEKTYYSSENKKLAEDKLVSLAITNPDIWLTKEYSLIEGNNLMAEPVISVKTSKTKPKKSNGLLKEKHRYIFYGYAPE